MDQLPIASGSARDSPSKAESLGYAPVAIALPSGMPEAGARNATQRIICPDLLPPSARATRPRGRETCNARHPGPSIPYGLGVSDRLPDLITGPGALVLRRWVHDDIQIISEAVSESVEHLRLWMP